MYEVAQLTRSPSTLAKTPTLIAQLQKKQNMGERMRNMQKKPRGIVCKVVERPAAEKPSSLEGQLLKSGPAFLEDWLKSRPAFLEDWRQI